MQSVLRWMTLACVLAQCLAGCARDWRIFEPIADTFQADNAVDVAVREDVQVPPIDVPNPPVDVPPIRDVPAIVDVPPPVDAADAAVDASDAATCGTAGLPCCMMGPRCDTNLGCNSTMMCEPCSAAMAVCSDVCVDLQSDDRNCGTCGTRCLGGRSCIMGMCAR